MVIVSAACRVTVKHGVSNFKIVGLILREQTDKHTDNMHKLNAL